MKKTGAWLAVYALEQIGVKHTFGIPGVHNTESVVLPSFLPPA